MPGLPLNAAQNNAIDFEAEAVRSDYEPSIIEVPPESPHPDNMMRYPTDRQSLEQSLDEVGVPRRPTRLGPDPKLV